MFKNQNTEITEVVSDMLEADFSNYLNKLKLDDNNKLIDLEVHTEHAKALDEQLVKVKPNIHKLKRYTQKVLGRNKTFVDRLNDYKGYSFDNIQLMTWQENKDKGHRDCLNGINNKEKF